MWLHHFKVAWRAAVGSHAIKVARTSPILSLRHE
jgi:hypothetical protein